MTQNPVCLGSDFNSREKNKIKKKKTTTKTISSCHREMKINSSAAI